MSAGVSMLLAVLLIALGFYLLLSVDSIFWGFLVALACFGLSMIIIDATLFSKITFKSSEKPSVFHNLMTGRSDDKK